jgi:hypothetical protein
MAKVTKNKTITVQDIPVNITLTNRDDYISLTDMAKAKTDTSRAADVIKNWLRSRTTLEFLAAWETLYNPDLKWSNSTTLRRMPDYILSR